MKKFESFPDVVANILLLPGDGIACLDNENESSSGNESVSLLSIKSHQSGRRADDAAGIQSADNQVHENDSGKCFNSIR